MFKYKKYIDDILNKNIVSCEAIYLAVKRHSDDLEKSNNKNYPYYFDDKEAERPIVFVKNLVHTKGEWAGTNIDLEAWQEFNIACIFGWRNKKTKLRRFKKVYFQIARKNGKTTMLSGIGNYCLFCDSPYEAGAEIYYIATKREQSKIAWSEAERQIRKCKALDKLAITYKQTLTITKKMIQRHVLSRLVKIAKLKMGLILILLALMNTMPMLIMNFLMYLKVARAQDGNPSLLLLLQRALIKTLFVFVSMNMLSRY